MAKKKSKAKASTVKETKPIFATAEVLEQAVPPTLELKLCRLCETKDGPYLNIFDEDQNISKKIDLLMPFTVSESDNLPHKVCFRCSAKIEELYDFVEKCKKAQDNLSKLVGSKVGTPKCNIRKIWEDKLNKSNISNEDICDALIRKAMEGIGEVPPPLPKPIKVVDPKLVKQKVGEKKLPERKVPERKVPERKAAEDKAPTIAAEKPLEVKPIVEEKKPEKHKRSISPPIKIPEKSKPIPVPEKKVKNKKTNELKITLKLNEETSKVMSIDKLSFDYAPNDEDESEDDRSYSDSCSPVKSTPEPIKEVITEKFDMQKHVTCIKVNNVGQLFQCSLCNRNFLTKEIVSNHSCARNSRSLNTTPDPPPPIISTPVIPPPIEPPPPKYKSTVAYINCKTVDTNSSQNNISSIEVKKKPKIGPASKVKKNVDPMIGMRITPKESTPPRETTPPKVEPSLSSMPTIAIPGRSNKFRLIPGPNNSFTLIEEEPEQIQEAIKRKIETIDLDADSPPPPKKSGPKSKRKTPHVVTPSSPAPAAPESSPPYPVGFFHSPLQPQPPVPFTTPAMKKQSYTIVQTGNPSKLLISTKPVQESKKAKKSKNNDKPYSVTLEDASRPKDPSLFTFVNVDPLLQPSYVLPTDNIQEAQITTSSSTPTTSKTVTKETYKCGMCPEKFTREKKLLAHLQAHYQRIDAAENSSRKRNRKS